VMLSDIASRVGLLVSVKDQTQHIAEKIDSFVADMTTLVSQVEEINVAPLHAGLKEVAAQVEGSLKPTMEKMDELVQLSKTLQDKQDKVAQTVDSHTQGSSIEFKRVHTDSGRVLGAVGHLEELLQTTLSQDRDSVFISQLNALESQLVAMSSVVAKEEHLSTLHELVALVQNVQGQVATSTTVSEILTLCQSSSEKLDVVRSKFPAITHVDLSCRIQTVTRESNFLFWQLLNAFESLTGEGMLINTSFNVRGEPIVCNPDEAYGCFMNTEMDMLVINNFVFLKSDQLPRVGSAKTYVIGTD